MVEDEGTTQSAKSSWGAGLIVWPAIVLALYALSVGPVAKYYPNPPKGLRMAYAPLAYLYVHVPPVKAFYDWYAKMWGTHL